MGGVAMGADRIAKDCIIPTFKQYALSVLNKIPHQGPDTILGSAGKKPTSGDIDIALDTKLSIREVSTILDSIGIPYKVGLGFNQIWTLFQQYDEHGLNGKSVQVDLMLGNLDWLKFAYWAPTPEETRFTAHHRSVLIAAIVRYAEELPLPDGNTQTHVVNWGTGLWTKKRIMYVNKKGVLTEKQIKSKSPVITTPQGVADFISHGTGKTWTVDELQQPFEKLWDKTVSVFNEDRIVEIAKYVLGAIVHRGGNYEIPEVICDALKA